MLDGLRQSWRHFKSAEPGQRFLQVYQRHQESRRTTWGKLASIGLAIAIVVVGVVGLAVPGPGLVVIGLGVAILGRESKSLARFLDRAECRLVPPVRRVRDAWRRLPAVARIGILLAIGAVAAIALFGFYVWLVRG